MLSRLIPAPVFVALLPALLAASLSAQPAPPAPAPLSSSASSSASPLADPATLALADAALAKLTLEEKISLLAGAGTMHLAGVPRAGIPELWFTDGPHNVRPDLRPDSFNHAGRTDDHSTALPSLSALAATWDTDLALAFGQLLGREARERGKDVLLGPGVNLVRTPLCGRNWEYLGEDPVLSARLAVPYIRGVQSQGVAACIKHYLGNEQELNRHGVDAAMDERTLRELYLVPFEAAVREAGVLAVMSGYNRFRGDYCSHSDLLNHQILKRELGFTGFVVTDWGSAHDTLGAALGGTDIEMNAGNAIRHFRQPLLDAVRAGQVPEALIDDKARRVLYVMARVGLLDARPRAPGARNTPEHAAFARQVAERAIVLLKNDPFTPAAPAASSAAPAPAPLLPLDRARVGRLLVIGQNATARHAHLGYSAEGKPRYEITPLEGLRRLLGDTVKIDHIPGPFTDTFSSVPESVIETIDADNLTQGVAVKGWRATFVPADAAPPATPLANAFHRRPDFDWRGRSPAPGVPKDGYATRWETEITVRETGDYVFQLQHDGRARLRLDDQLLLDAWQPGSHRDSRAAITLQAGRRLTLTADHLPAPGQGRFRLTWRPPSAIPLTPAAVAARAAAADTVLFFTGNAHGHGRAMECEAGDRPDLSLPEGDDEAIAAVLAAQPRTVVINLSGSAVALPWIDQAPALVQYWFAGQEGGNALARVLFGAVNPGGKLPFVFPRRLTDSPAHALDDYNGQRVHYREGLLIGQRWHDAKNIPALFPFGHGLSYTTFAYADLAARETGPASFEVTLTVKNTGPVTGDEIVQLYVEPRQSRLPRPIRELKAFARVHALAPGESRRVTLTLTPRDFSYYDPATASWVADPGTYVLHAAASATELRAAVAVVLR
jgi:beta-glucosidase